jgi:hypothetical protein
MFLEGDTRRSLKKRHAAVLPEVVPWVVMKLFLASSFYHDPRDLKR